MTTHSLYTNNGYTVCLYQECFFDIYYNIVMMTKCAGDSLDVNGVINGHPSPDHPRRRAEHNVVHPVPSIVYQNLQHDDVTTQCNLYGI